MDIKKLQELMIEHSIVLRAIPKEVRGVYEARHINQFPNGTILYLEEYKREMLVVYTVPKNAGKFIIEQANNTSSTVGFKGKIYFDTIEEAIASLDDVCAESDGRRKAWLLDEDVLLEGVIEMDVFKPFSKKCGFDSQKTYVGDLGKILFYDLVEARVKTKCNVILTGDV